MITKDSATQNVHPGAVEAATPGNCQVPPQTLNDKYPQVILMHVKVWEPLAKGRESYPNL